MPTVSVLIPAYRPDYLDVAIASVLAQSYTDFELLISDDSTEEFVGSVVSKWNDPRIQFFRNPNTQLPGANRDFLLQSAKGRFIKFVFDDDYLLPGSIENLVNIAQQTESQLVFHGRHFVDERGCVLSSMMAIEAGTFAILDRRTFFEDLIGRTVNFIGEPSNVLFETEAFRKLERPFALHGIPARFLTDVVLYANLLIQGYRITAAGFMGSAFRQHRKQNSNAASPFFPAGRFEWELLLRWAVDHGGLAEERYWPAIKLVHRGYLEYVRSFPELLAFLELEGRPGAHGYWSDEILEATLLAHMSMELRRLRTTVVTVPS